MITCGLHKVLVGVCVPNGGGHHGHCSRVTPEGEIKGESVLWPICDEMVGS